jgi:hypothetical protein
VSAQPAIRWIGDALGRASKTKLENRKISGRACGDPRRSHVHRQRSIVSIVFPIVPHCIRSNAFFLVFPDASIVKAANFPLQIDCIF